MEDAPTAQPGLDTVTAKFNGVKIFCVAGSDGPGQATRRLLAWLSAQPHCEVRDVIVTQSNHRAEITITLFYWEER